MTVLLEWKFSEHVKFPCLIHCGILASRTALNAVMNKYKLNEWRELIIYWNMSLYQT